MTLQEDAPEWALSITWKKKENVCDQSDTMHAETELLGFFFFSYIYKNMGNCFSFFLSFFFFLSFLETICLVLCIYRIPIINIVLPFFHSISFCCNHMSCLMSYFTDFNSKFRYCKMSSEQLEKEYDIFLVHCTDDQSLAVKVKEALTSKGLKIFAHYDEGSTFKIGRATVDCIMEAVKISRIVLILMTENALKVLARAQKTRIEKS